MTLRRTIFWIHLGVGVTAAVVILMMSVTGVILTYEMQLNEWARRGYRATPSGRDAKPLPADALIERAARATPEAEPSSIALRADPLAPAAVGFGRRQTLYVDRYTGEIRGDGDTGMRRFLRAVMYWHRWFAVSDDNRAIGRAITGAANLGFLFLVVSGFYLWWPRTWTRRSLRRVTWFRRGLGPKARDFNWHNVIGFWTAVPLLIIVFSGAMISYRWVGDLIHLAVGETPPTRGARAAASARASDEPARPADLLEMRSRLRSRFRRCWRSAGKPCPSMGTRSPNPGRGRCDRCPQVNAAERQAHVDVRRSERTAPTGNPNRAPVAARPPTSRECTR